MASQQINVFNNPLDTISYIQNGDGTLQKTVVNITTIPVVNIPNELSALQTQLTSLQNGTQNTQTIAVIPIYQSAIAFLQSAT